MMFIEYNKPTGFTIRFTYSTASSQAIKSGKKRTGHYRGFPCSQSQPFTDLTQYKVGTSVTASFGLMLKEFMCLSGA